MKDHESWEGWPDTVRCPDCQETFDVPAAERRKTPLPCPHCQFLIRVEGGSYASVILEMLWDGTVNRLRTDPRRRIDIANAKWFLAVIVLVVLLVVLFGSLF